MARIRSIKPEFWSSEQVVDCSPIARLLFLGLLNFCDDNGIQPVGLRRIRMNIFPGDDLTTHDIEKLLGELSSNGLIFFFTEENQDYLIVTGWKKHQKIDKPSFKYPRPRNTRRMLVERHPAESKGEEEDVEEEETASLPLTPSPIIKNPDLDLPLVKTAKFDEPVNGKGNNHDRQSRGSRLAADWQPDEQDRLYALNLGFNGRAAQRIAADFRDYWIAKAGAAAAKRDWPATWRVWCRKEHDRLDGSAAKQSARKGSSVLAATFELLAEDELER